MNSILNIDIVVTQTHTNLLHICTHVNFYYCITCTLTQVVVFVVSVC